MESIKASAGVERRLWPYRMDAGVPQNRHRIKKGAETDEARPGLWEVPVWVLLHEGQRYCMGEWLRILTEFSRNPDSPVFLSFCGADPGRGGEGNDAEGDPYAILKSNLDAAYGGNRAPLPFYIHVFWFNGVSGGGRPSVSAIRPLTAPASLLPQEREKRGRRFVEYALSKPGVYFVTMQTLIAWMQAPVPVEGMDEWLRGRCAGPEGGGHSVVDSDGGGVHDGIKAVGEGKKGKVKGLREKERAAATAGLVAAAEGGLSGGSMALAAAVAAVMVILARRRRARRAGKALR